MPTRCPICGAVIQPEAVPAIRTISFECYCCRSRLQVVTPDRTALDIVSAAVGIAISLLLSVHALTLILTIPAITLVVFALGSFLLSVIGTPKLERSRTKVKPLPGRRIVRAAH